MTAEDPEKKSGEPPVGAQTEKIMKNSGGKPAPTPEEQQKAPEPAPTAIPTNIGEAVKKAYEPEAPDASAKQDPKDSRFHDRTKERGVVALGDTESLNARVDRLDKLDKEVTKINKQNTEFDEHYVQQTRDTNQKISALESAQYKPSWVRKAIGTLAVASLGILYFDAVYTKQRALDELKAADSALEAKIAAIKTNEEQQSAIPEKWAEYINNKIEEASATAAADNAETKAYAENTTQEVKAALQQVRDALGENKTEIARNRAETEANKVSIGRIHDYAHGVSTSTAEAIAECSRRFTEYVRSQEAARKATPTVVPLEARTGPTYPEATPSTPSATYGAQASKRYSEAELIKARREAQATTQTAERKPRYTPELDTEAEPVTKTAVQPPQKTTLQDVLRKEIVKLDPQYEQKVAEAANYNERMLGNRWEARRTWRTGIELGKSFLLNGMYGTENAKKSLGNVATALESNISDLNPQERQALVSSFYARLEHEKREHYKRAPQPAPGK